MPDTRQEIEHARLAVERFVARFDESYRLLAFHAALPLVLTPELLSYLRSQFLRGRTPWVAEIDLLLATDLCQQVGHEQYALEPAVRAYLLGEMRRRPDLGVDRMQAVARLLIDYVRHLSRSRPTLGEANLRAQEWSAMVFLDDQRELASRAIAESFRKASPAALGIPTAAERSELLRLTRITQSLAPELGDYPELVEFAETLGQMFADPRGIEVGPPVPTTPGQALASPSDRLIPLPTLQTPGNATTPPADVFRSTTAYVTIDSEGPGPFRSRVFDTLRRLGINAVAGDDDGVAGLSLGGAFPEIAACDFYIGIFFSRAGYFPVKDDPRSQSITELEYRHAVHLGKPRLIFLRGTEADWSIEPAGLSLPPPPIGQLGRELVKEAVVRYFRTSTELASQVAEAIRQQLPTAPATDVSAAPEPPQEVSKPEPAHGPVEIFVSYARVDDQPHDGSSDGWVRTLVRHLQVLLDRRLGQFDMCKFWMNHTLGIVNSLESDFARRIRRSDIVLVILSPAYLGSEWTRQEMTFFQEEMRKRSSIDGRIFIIETDRVERPEELRNLLEYRFWVTDPMSGRPRLLGFPQPLVEDRRYFELLDDLSRDLAKVVKQERATPQPTQGLSEADPGHTVYLAEVPEALDEMRVEVKRYLEQYGLRVLPWKSLPAEASYYREVARADMRESLLFVQLLDESKGRKLDDGTRGPSIQLELAQEIGLPILQWRSRDRDPRWAEDRDVRELLEMPTVIACDLSEFKRMVFQRYEKLIRPAPPPRPSAQIGQNKLVFVNSDRVDVDLADEVSRELQSLGFWVSLPKFSGAPSELRIHREECLAECDGLLLIWGQVGARWIEQQLMESRRALARRQAPLEFMGIYQGSQPGTPLKFLIPNLRLIDGQYGVAKARIGEILLEAFTRPSEGRPA